MRLKSIRFQLLTIMLLCYLVPTLLLGGCMGAVFFSDLRDKTEKALSSGAEHALTLTRQSVERAIDLAKDATYDGELTGAYAAYETGATGSAEFLQLSRNYLERKYSREPLFTLAVTFPTVNPELLIYNRSSYEQAQRYEQSVHARVVQMGETLDTRCQFIEEAGTIYLVRNLYNLRLERYGMLVLGVDRAQLFGQFDALALSWDAQMNVCLGETGVSDAEWTALAPGISNSTDGDAIVYTQMLREQDYTLGMCMTVLRSRVYGEMETFRRMLSALLLLLAPVMALILLFVSRRIVRPIRLLSQASRRIEAGELGVTVPMNGGDELGDLGRAFSNMSTRIAELIDRTYKEEIALRDARIQAMQSRINPHFINNALESINWQARMEGAQSVGAMVEALSVLLNASMARGDRRLVPLREEVEVLQAYFYFIRLRFGKRLSVHTRIDEETLDCVVPLLTLQPLIENAVEHGIAPAGGGQISVSCLRGQGFLSIEVRNDGRALDERDRKRIEKALGGDSQGGHHLGLSNIASRLHLIYGQRASIHVEADEDSAQTVVRIRLPEREEVDA